MKDPNKELTDLFKDSRLTPSDAFQKRLGQQLQAKPKRSFKRFLTPIAAVAMFAVLLLGVSLFQPAGPKDLANRTVLLRNLYATALADTLPAVKSVNFWSITSSTEYGPAAERCGLITEDSDILTEPTTTLYYNDKTTSAVHSYGGYGTKYPVIGYSEDPDVPAFVDAELKTDESSVIRNLLVNTTLTDKAGKDLPKDATAPLKSSGTYDLYARYNNGPNDPKNFVEGCENLVIHVQVDAKKGNFDYFEIFKDTIDAENLYYAQKQTVEVRQVKSFSEVRPIFDAAGFDMEVAKARTAQNDYITVTNKAAGLEFYYRKSALGKATVEVIKNRKGETIDYQYSFSKQPLVIYHFRTAVGQEQTEYKSVSDLKAKALANNWTIVDDMPQPNIGLEAYGQTSSHFFKAHDGVNYYVLMETGSTDIPSVYVSIPYGLGDKMEFYDTGEPSYISNDLLSPASGAQFFRPGTSPFKGL